MVLRVGALLCQICRWQKLTRLKVTEILSTKVGLVGIKSITSMVWNNLQDSCPFGTHSYYCTQIKQLRKNERCRMQKETP